MSRPGTAAIARRPPLHRASILGTAQEQLTSELNGRTIRPPLPRVRSRSECARPRTTKACHGPFQRSVRCPHNEGHVSILRVDSPPSQILRARACKVTAPQANRRELFPCGGLQANRRHSAERNEARGSREVGRGSSCGRQSSRRPRLHRNS